MKVQYSESAVKPEFLVVTTIDKEPNQLNTTSKDLKALKSATKDTTVKPSNCKNHSLEYNKHMGDNVLRLRVLNNLSSNEFADKLGVSFQQLYRYENGINKISGKILASIARVLYSKINSRTSGRLEQKIFLEMIIDYFNFKIRL